MTPEELSEQLQALYGSRLKSVILYGSAAAGDHAGKHSNYNVLVVLDRLGREELEQLAPLARQWMRRGNPPPLLFTPERLATSGEVFPLEVADLKDAHRMLYGDDVLQALRVDLSRLRFQLVHELHGKLLQLRGRFLVVAGRARQTRRLLIESVSTFLVLCRAALRLYQSQVPSKKMEALEQLASHVSIRQEVFHDVLRLKRGARVSGQELERLLADYLQSVEALVSAIEHGVQSQ